MSSPTRRTCRFLPLCLLLIGCGGATDTSPTTTDTDVESACIKVCQQQAPVACPGFSLQDCEATCAARVTAVKECETQMLSATQCEAQLPVSTYRCSGSTPELEQVSCDSQFDNARECLASSAGVTGGSCAASCDKSFAQACPDKSRLGSCKSSCALFASAYPGCVSVFEQFNACVSQLPVTEFECVGNDVDFGDNCSKEVAAYMKCVSTVEQE
jgi:hypothetical protein